MKINIENNIEWIYNDTIYLTKRCFKTFFYWWLL